MPVFTPLDFDIEVWLTNEKNNLLQKICNIYDVDGLIVEQYKTRVKIFPIGTPMTHSRGRLSDTAPALYRTFNYDEEGNITASVPVMREWTQACEDLAQGNDPIDPTPPNGVPLGLKVAKSTYIPDDVNSVAGGATVTVVSKQLLPNEAIYLRHVVASGNNQAKFQVLINGSPLQTKRTWFGDFDKDFWFHTANGGILYENEELITLSVTNCSDDDGDFEGAIGFVLEAAP